MSDPQRNGLGTAGFVLGLLGLVFSFIPVVGVVAWPLVVVGLGLGLFGLVRVVRGQADNKGVAIAGVVLSAIGLALPPKRITVNLSPADLPKEGSHYDLPIALGLLGAMGVVDAETLGGYVAVGELGLDGRLTASPGVLLAAPQSADLAVLKRLADELWVRDRARSPAMVKRLWAACGLPDFRKLGIDPHARFVSRVFGYLSEGRGVVPNQWFADEVSRLDTIAGDVEPEDAFERARRHVSSSAASRARARPRSSARGWC